jgi:hypothetical protein
MGKHKRVEKLCYVHRNPVKRGLVFEPDRVHQTSFGTMLAAKRERCRQSMESGGCDAEELRETYAGAVPDSIRGDT